MGWLSFKAQYAIASGNMKIEPKTLQADNCPYTFNQTTPIFDTPSDEYIFPLYKVSYMWYTCFAAIFTIVITLLCSAFIFGWNDPKSISSELITPIVGKRIFKKAENKTRTPATLKDTEF